MISAATRALFPVTRNVVYFNHAAVGPLSVRAVDGMRKHAEDQQNFGALHWRDWYAEYDLLKQSAATLIGATPQEIAILKNTSEGLSFVAEGFRWERGDNVVTTAIEFPSNSTPWRRLERRGVECRIAPSPDEVERFIDERTRIVSVSSVAFHNGHRADLDAIGEICKRRSVLLCVDAIQSIGVLPIAVKKANVAFLAADGHKWMCGPEGAALFFVAAEHRDKLEVLESGWTNFDRKGKFIDCAIDLLPDARRFEAGSLNTNGIYGLRAALDLLLGVGIDSIEREVLRLASRLADELERIGFTIHSPRPIRSGIVAATPPDVENHSVLWYHRKLEENRVVCAPREGFLRFSPHFYNDDDEVDRVVALLNSFAS